jgi:GTP-binding protein EngB required for normal cell division
MDSQTISLSTANDELKNYARAKQQLAARLREVKQFLAARGDDARAAECQALFVKLAEDRFNLAVLGQFKRGKSSLMNAIIGRDLLPTGLLPLTSAITTLCYGPKPRVILKRQGWSLDDEIPLDELAQYVTEQGNPGNEKGLVEARVELPVPFLRRGLYFIDTPGIGSARQQNTATTYAFLPEADAALFITSVEAPLSESEQAFLRDLRALARKLFIVVNKMDLLAPAEHEPVLGYLRAGLTQILGSADVRLFPLSARLGLLGKQNNDPVTLSASGLQELEDALAAFLVHDKQATFLNTLLERTQGLLSQGDGEADALRAELDALRASLTQGVTESIEPREIPSAGAPILEQAIVSQRADTGKRDGQVARSGTCPVCDAQTRAVIDFFAAWQYTLATDEKAQREFAAARGFCHFHTWQFQEIASPQGLSAGYADLIDARTNELRAALEKMAPLTDAPQAETCAACRVAREAQEHALRHLLAQLATTEGRARYEKSAGLCLPHLRAALARAPAELAEMLTRAQIERLTEISEDMRNYLIKREALRRGLLNANEEKAWRRALVQLVGERNVRFV